MMRKLLILMLVLGLTSVASATIVGLHIDPAAPGGSPATALNPSETAIVYITVDTTGAPGTMSPLNLGAMDAVISIDGGGATGTIIDAIKAADANPLNYWGAQVNWYAGPPPALPNVSIGGWQPALSFNPIYGAGNQSVEVGMGQFGNQVYITSIQPMVPQPPDGMTHFVWWVEGAVGYVEIHCLDQADINVSIANGQFWGGTTMDDTVTVPNFGGPVTVYQIPEPATVALLGLGSLFLLRRRR